MKVRCLVAAFAAANLAAGAACAQDLLIRGARVHTASAAGTLENTDVLIQGGRITDVGAGLAAPAGVTIVEAKGRALTPGLFGGLTQIGLKEISLEPSTVDAELELLAPAWQHHWRPEFDVTPAFNPRSSLVPVARIEGMTWTMLAPLSDRSLVAGQGAAVTLDGRFDAVLGGSRSLFVNWGSAGDEGSGGSRAAQFMLFDQAIREVRQPETAGEGALLLPEGRAALKTYLAGGRVVFRAERASDIRQVVHYAKRHGIKPVIAGGSEAWLIAEQLAAADVPVLLDVLDNLPGDFDRLGARLDNAALLHVAGVRIAFSNDDSHQARKNRQLAGNAVAHGLPWNAALAAITSGPAEIFGIGNDRGRIEKGKAADLVLWSGDPLEVTTVADQVWIAGQPVDMRSRQTELRDRYLERLRSNSVR
ncbi:MAG TPA: amidohydrolase family protein [Steroidobacteraceae bacterium]|nr:amidohydrolase family protein [Steroidobacteraceae bacterium]